MLSLSMTKQAVKPKWLLMKKCIERGRAREEEKRDAQMHCEMEGLYVTPPHFSSPVALMFI